MQAQDAGRSWTDEGRDGLRSWAALLQDGAPARQRHRQVCAEGINMLHVEVVSRPESLCSLPLYPLPPVMGEVGEEATEVCIEARCRMD